MKVIHPVNHLDFEPPFGLKSPHFQTIIGCFYPTGVPPISEPLIIPLGDGDSLFCEVATPPKWQSTEKTVVLIHGLGGSTQSSYMIRCSRKLYEAGYRIVSVNLRGCGPGKKYAVRPYHGGLSQDILVVLQTLKQQSLLSPIVLVGFSLGGNIVLKLAGELGTSARALIDSTIAICPCIDLAQSSAFIARPVNHLYKLYYLRSLEEQARQWTEGQKFSNLYEFDSIVTAPYWGFEGVFDYYQQCSSRFILQKIDHPCRILFAADDPFIDYKASLGLPLPDCVKVYLTEYGGHLGFLAKANKWDYCFWMDNLLLQWIAEKN